jgi:hypothetical protein
MAERDGSDFCCRHWLFFGPQEIHKRTLSPSPVVKIGAARKGRLSSNERIADPIPEELRTIRERMGFDYGKFDYGIVNGKVFLYDVNRTPGASSDPRNHAETIEVLSEGLQALLSL